MGLSVFRIAHTAVSCCRDDSWHHHSSTTSLVMAHVGRPNRPAVSEPEHQSFRFTLDAEQPVVNKLMMGATEGEQVLF